VPGQTSTLERPGVSSGTLVERPADVAVGSIATFAHFSDVRFYSVSDS